MVTMLKATQIGKIRIDLAEILSQWCGEHVAPTLLVRNYGSRNFGYALSWDYGGERSHPLCGVGSGMTMTEFVKFVKQGYSIVLHEGELFIQK